MQISAAVIATATGLPDALASSNKYRLGLRAVNYAGLQSCPGGNLSTCSSLSEGAWAVSVGFELHMDTVAPRCDAMTAWLCAPLWAVGRHSRCTDVSLSSDIVPAKHARGGLQADNSTLVCLLPPLLLLSVRLCVYPLAAADHLIS